MALDRDTLTRLWPQAPDALVGGIVETAPAVLARHDITTPLRLAHFLAQISHESGGGTITRESLNYTHASRIREVWPSRFPTDAAAEPYVRNPEGLADRVYQGRMGNTQPGDGARYAGRGLLQITGRDSYREIGTLTGLDLINQPDLAFAAEHALEVAAAEFKHLGCLPLCDKDDLRAVTERVNGGLTGLSERATWLARWRPLAADIAADPLPTPSAVMPARNTAEEAAPPAAKSGWLASILGAFGRKST
jgi:putative chitinase